MRIMNWLLRILIFLCLAGMGYLILNPPCGDTFPTYPTFSPEIKWDISKKDSRVSRAFSIPVGRSYTYAFILYFKITDTVKDIPKVWTQVMEITGDRYNGGGITIPIHIKLEMLDVNKTGQEATTLDETVNTKGVFRFGNREIDREIAKQRLAPGRYVVTVTTTGETSLPDWIETYFSIGLSGSAF